MQGLVELYKVIKANPNVEILLNLIDKVCQKHEDLSPEEFAKTEEYQFLKVQISQLKIQNMEQIEKKLPKFLKKMGFMIKTTKFMTVVFLLMPKGESFKWHDHSLMNVICRCQFGQLQIQTLDSNQIQKNEDQIKVLRENIRTENLLPCKVSQIDPIRFNIHRIEAIKQSGFFDFMFPNYPTKRQQETEIVLKQLPSSFCEEIVQISKALSNL